MGSDKFVLDNILNNPHAAEITVCVANPRLEHQFATASLDGQLKIWDKIGTWQNVSDGNWHARPILSGCFGMDGSVLALGFHGFAVLWDPVEAVEMHALALEHADDKATQLHFSMAGDRLLLLAGTRSAEHGRESVTCFDLLSLEIVARLDLA